ncbi:MAG: orotidine-5'-phosphate decarboxylase [Zoogloeaceae bacterium]|jgi:orotidine-5'-phosphate decarboxylase|nr:orotidine-5'-phosphate decarboxylase [Zoogloeaceae bacterium]
MIFTEQLAAAQRKNDSLLCVGLDPDPARFPAVLREHPDAIYAFCTAIVDATADCVCAFKPQIAYFAAQRAEAALEKLVAYIHAQHPGIPVILDAKRGDIGATARQYAVEAFDRYQADAVTVNPYMGFDSIEPYLSGWPEKGVILLCRTSNPGGSDLQFLEVRREGERLFERVARLAADVWNKNGQLALVVGATFPAEIACVRKLVGNMPLLTPGIGAQGGDVEATVKAGQTAEGGGLILNASRAILYAGNGADYAQSARAAAETIRVEINRYRKR